LKKKIDLIFLYANEIEKMKFQGGTGIIDHKRAIQELPLHLRRVLEEERFETLGLEEPYYSNASSDDWLHIPVFQELGWVRKMSLYFNYAEEKEASWKTRIVGYKDHETKKFFEQLIQFFKNPRYCFLHFWNKGDLIIMDNRRVVHYREPFDDTGKRVIFRLQVFYESN
jgi:(5R)-carbapenem-3-carboxylate synthase